MRAPPRAHAQLAPSPPDPSPHPLAWHAARRFLSSRWRARVQVSVARAAVPDQPTAELEGQSRPSWCAAALHACRPPTHHARPTQAPHATTARACASQARELDPRAVARDHSDRRAGARPTTEPVRCQSPRAHHARAEGTHAIARQRHASAASRASALHTVLHTVLHMCRPARPASASDPCPRLTGMPRLSGCALHAMLAGDHRPSGRPRSGGVAARLALPFVPRWPPACHAAHSPQSLQGEPQGALRVPHEFKLVVRSQTAVVESCPVVDRSRPCAWRELPCWGRVSVCV